MPYHLMAYRPRQFRPGLTIGDPTRGQLTVEDPGPYAGWDVLTTINDGSRRIATSPDWLRIDLQRDATLAVIWRGGNARPAWLGEWTEAEEVVVAGKRWPTFRRSFPGGTVDLGGVYDPHETPTGGRDTYWVLFAEAGGQPSVPPPVPNGREEPRPNETCPTWVHDEYTTMGPDGRAYPTWHHLIHPVYWCYHRHEHGSNPVHFGEDHAVPFGYVAAAHGMDEPHAGFKNLTFESGGVRWWITMHFGTAGLARACNRFHTLSVAARDAATGEVLADLHLMADYGRSLVNAGDAPITPPSCPDQAAQAAGSSGVRKLPTKQDSPGPGYEPWRPDFRSTVLGLSGSLVINTFDPMVICNTSACDEPVATGQSGSLRFLDANGFTVTAGARNSGVFYTDPMGGAFLGPNDLGAIRQFLKPGLTLTLNHGDKCRDVAAWGRPFVCNGPTVSAPTDREGAIQAPN